MIDMEEWEKWAASTKTACLAPSPEIVTLDGVRCRVWLGRSEGGLPMRLAVHRVLMDAAEADALLAEFPIISECVPPASIKLASDAAPGVSQ